MRYLATVIFFLFTQLINAQPPTAISYLGIEQGLSNNSVSSIYKDHLGFMWFGTYDGLNRYDGYDFKIFRHKHGDSLSINNNWISCIEEDSTKRLWIGTRNGADIYDPVHANFHLVQFKPAGENKLQFIDGGISEIKTNKTGTVFIASSMYGLLICPKNRVIANQVYLRCGNQLIKNYYASAITFNAKNEAYITVREKGIYKYNEEKNELIFLNDAPKNSLCLKADNKNNLWIGCDDGLFKYDIKHAKTDRIFFSNNRIVRLTLTGNTLWIASDGDGILVKDIDSGSVHVFAKAGKPSPITSSAVYAVYHDNENRTWIGTLRGGIDIIDPKKSSFQALVHNALNDNSLVNNFTLSCCEDDAHNIWIGTDGGGLSYYNRQKNTYKNYTYSAQKNALSNNFVTNLLHDDSDNIWVATWGGGINRFNKQTKNFEHFSCNNPRTELEDKNIWTLYQDKQKNIWAGACVDGALYKLNRQRNQFEAFDTTLRNMIALYEDNEGQFWGGDYYSLIKIDPAQKKHIRYPIGFAVRSIYEDAQRNLWIGTEGSGLLLFNKHSGKYISFTEENGLSNNAVLQILPDGKGNLWLSTFKGISVFNIHTKTFKNIFQSDGLLSNQLSYNAALKLQSGEFMFGGIKGMNIFYPDKIQKASKKLKLLLTAITINNTPAEKDSICVTKKNFNGISAIRLPFDKAVVSLNFVTPEYSTPDKITYAYYLQGWDKGWNYSGKNRTATYTRLHEGNYIFKVKAADAYGNWSAAQNLLNIVVLPPWYRTWWAYLFYIAVVISIIYLYIHYRSRQIKLQYQVAYAKKEIEKEKELNEKKLSFFTNISHEFRSPLTLIINPLKELMQSAEQTSEKTELNTVYRNAKRLLSLVDQLLLFRKADTAEDRLKVQKINFYNLSKEVYECFTQQAKAKHIHYSFNCDNVQLQLYGDYEKLEIILFNLLSNALKFTPDGGDVVLSVEEKMNAVEVRVSDSGCGVSEAEGNKLFNRFYQSNNKQNASTGFGIGLYLAKKFTSAHKGALMYESKTGKGTTFILTLQKGFAHIKEYLCEEVITEKPQLIEELSEDFLQQPQEHAALKNGNALFTKEVLSEKKKVIIADDDEEVRQYLKQILHDKYLVKECSDAESVLETATQQPPDLIISDVVMKEMNGITLCRKIKEESALTHIPVILLTSASSQEIKLNGIECGADDYIIKPFDKALLLARIENIFKTRSTLQQYFFDTITLQNTATKVSAEYKNFLERCIAIVEENLDRDDFSIKILSKEIGMSHSGLYKKIKLVSGLSANAFIRFIRLRRAAVLMLTANTNINEAAFQVGIKDVKYFRTQFNKLFGMNPSEYIKKYKHSFNKDFSFIID